MCVCTNAITHMWRAEDNFVELALSIRFYMSFRDRTQVARLASVFTH